MTRKNYPLKTAPRVIETESPASWLLRLCYSHLVKFDHLFKTQRLVPPKDVDIVSYGKLFKRFAYSGNLPPSHLDAIANWFEPLVTNSRAGQALHKELNGKPYSHFCPHCLGEDKIPHLRPEWRLKFWGICPKHECKMIEACPKCLEHQHTDKVNLRLDVDQLKTPLRYCVHCSADLTKSSTSSLMDLDMHDKLVAQEYLLKICRFGKYSVGPLLLNSENQVNFKNPYCVLTKTQEWIVDFHMAYIDCPENNRSFYGLKKPISKRNFFEIRP